MEENKICVYVFKIHIKNAIDNKKFIKKKTNNKLTLGTKFNIY